jgi:hypothetical protein
MAPSRKTCGLPAVRLRGSAVPRITGHGWRNLPRSRCTGLAQTADLVHHAGSASCSTTPTRPMSDLLWPPALIRPAPAVPAALAGGRTEGSPLRRLAAALDVFSRLRLTHTRPDYGIHSVTVGDATTPVGEERNVLALPFGTLLHFAKDPAAASGPAAVLLVAPLSGHFATLLRDTVRTLLQDHDVYITDWHNARDVAAATAGRFGLDDYIEHMMRSWRHRPGRARGGGLPALRGGAGRHRGDGRGRRPGQPRSLTLMAGPVDCRINPTKVNEAGHQQADRMVREEPDQPRAAAACGAMRRVYPGFVQLSAFMSMNLDRHKNAFGPVPAPRRAASREGRTSSGPSTTSTWPSTTCRRSSTWRRWRRCSRPTTWRAGELTYRGRRSTRGHPPHRRC